MQIARLPPGNMSYTVQILPDRSGRSSGGDTSYIICPTCEILLLLLLLLLRTIFNMTVSLTNAKPLTPLLLFVVSAVCCCDQVLKFLHDHRSEGCSTLAVDFAAHNGHTEASFILPA